MTREQVFDKIILDFKSLHSLKSDRLISVRSSFVSIVDGLKQTKDSIYNQRITDLKTALTSRSHLIRLSTFELMEHDFRENSHSNVLQYIFDYSNLGEDSISILLQLILTTNTDTSKYISTNLTKKNYKVFREHPTENGRIDILISDDINKFNIVIENKLLANISVKEMNEKKEVTKTQLDDYYDFINKKFKEYKNLFFLLSYYTHDDEINNYEKINYETIYSAIKDIYSEDVVLSEYKSLLTSLITGIDKQEISSALQKVKANSSILLNSIEKLNKIISYEIQ
jgi:hypothetical protein